MEAESSLNTVGLCVRKEEKRKFNDLLRSARHLKGQTRVIARTLYDIDESEQALDDSDWMADLILLIADRVGDDLLKSEKLRNFIEEAFPSEMGMYDKLRVKRNKYHEQM